MTWATTYLAKNWDRLRLDGFGSPADLVPVLVTPRFQTSAHVVHLLLSRRTASPRLVIKAARNGSDAHGALATEAANLRALQDARPGGFSSVPRLLAFEVYEGTALLLETAVDGRVLKPSEVRRRPDRYAQMLWRWVTELHAATIRESSAGSRNCDESWGEPLERMAREHPLSAGDMALIERTRELLDPLRRAGVPWVFEHGDLSAPNILIGRDAALSVVDWELARPMGLPGHDLFLGLAFVAFARDEATDQRRDPAAFARAFFGGQAWAWPYVERYANALNLDPALLPRLFVACWSRYVAHRAERLRVWEGETVSAEDRWERVKCNRYFTLWEQAVARHAELPARLTFRPSVALAGASRAAVAGEAPCLR